MIRVCALVLYEQCIIIIMVRGGNNDRYNYTHNSLLDIKYDRYTHTVIQSYSHTVILSDCIIECNRSCSVEVSLVRLRDVVCRGLTFDLFLLCESGLQIRGSNKRINIS